MRREINLSPNEISFVALMLREEPLQYNILCCIVYLLNVFSLFFAHKWILGMAEAEKQPFVFVYIPNALKSSLILMFINMVFEDSSLQCPVLTCRWRHDSKGKLSVAAIHTAVITEFYD